MESEKAKWDYRGRVWEGFVGLWARLARKAKWGRAGRGRGSRVKRNRVGRDVDGRAGGWTLRPPKLVLKIRAKNEARTGLLKPSFFEHRLRKSACRVLAGARRGGIRGQLAVGRSKVLLHRTRGLAS